MRSSLSILVIATALLVAAPAVADDKPAGADPAGAAALFQQGRDAAKRKDFPTACARFSESYRLDPAPGTLLNLADCNQQIGKLASAWQMFREASEHLPAEDDRVVSARRRIAALEPRLPHLVVALAPGAPVQTHVARDGVDLGAGSLDVSLPVDPGEHAVVASSPGRLPRRFAIRLAEGETQRLLVEPGALAPAASAMPSSRPEDASPRGLGPMRTAGIVIAGVGVVGIGVAITTGLMLPGKQDTIDAHCDAQHRCDPTGVSAAHDGQTLASINTATWIAGGVAVAAGAALIVFGGRRAPSSPAALGVAPLPRGAAASLGGAF